MVIRAESLIQIDVAVNAPEAGIVKEYLAEEEDTVTVGQELVKLEIGSAQTDVGQEKGRSETKSSASAEQSTSSDPRPGIDKDPPLPSHTEADLEPRDLLRSGALEPPTHASSEPPERVESASKPGAAAAKSTDREERRVKMNRMRLRIAERLKQSQNTAASLTTFNEVDMSSLMQFRKLYKDEVLEKTGVKLGFMSAFSRACVLAMRDVPAVNASIEGSGNGDTIVYRDYVDISVAVATEKGLVTPVIRNAEQLGFISIEREIADLGKKVILLSAKVMTMS